MPNMNDDREKENGGMRKESSVFSFALSAFYCEAARVKVSPSLDYAIPKSSLK